MGKRSKQKDIKLNYPNLKFFLAGNIHFYF